MLTSCNVSTLLEILGDSPADEDASHKRREEFQPFLRFWLTTNEAPIAPTSPPTFQPFLRFWSMENLKSFSPHSLMFQPFLRFWRRHLQAEERSVTRGVKDVETADVQTPFQPFLRFWPAPQPPSAAGGPAGVSTLLEILVHEMAHALQNAVGDGGFQPFLRFWLRSTAPSPSA